MRIIVKHDHWLPKLLDVEGIVIYPFVLFSPPKEKMYSSLYKHEMAHVQQVRRTGWLAFYVGYLLASLANYLYYRDTWKAYWHIPHEFDARAVQSLPLTKDEKDELGL
jgi:hypothetical protein